MGGIIWLASYPKSGNTWVRTFLHNLLTNAERPADLNELSKFTIGDGNKGWYETVSRKPFDSLSPEEVAALIPKVQEAYARSRPDSVFVKTHNFLGKILDVPLITPGFTAGAVYIVRNPLDVVISLSDHYGLPLDDGIGMLNDPDAYSAETDRKVQDYLGSWSDHVKSWETMEKSMCHTMRYEDMLFKPEKTFGGLAKFLGLNPPKQRLRRAIKFSSFGALQKQEKEKGFNERSDKTEKFFRVGKAGQWKTALNPEQIDRITTAHSHMMEKYGYMPKARKTDKL
ncbi:sulfotransferase domain-containing protein [Sneathiella marina]|uniref:Sulfotransferase domain-containing protein n=1 Tax=Sneathiella marina TaxID=2950108 RepID=A0ABY4W6S5_9PROT|nr:sulfotransferase domain-containing protein [Sneathiella marina]USG61435.1 sulfotransferase domain-containing protein [Sneathiella marina]